MKKLATTLTLTAAALATTAACTDANVASRNASKAADQFEVDRRVVFINGITNEYLLEIQGRCSIEENHVAKQLAVICKVGDGEYKKHFLGLSDNVTYMAEQLEPVEADRYHYRVIFKPETIIPNIDRP